ncbi:hypothetical protein BO71DRAFT_42558 [Aspergillus ellipticus CBS 707.79]|uniref:Uncharacterized protein n=1 Tax=Aspergillus ellipticus CBS 707.79 TaxID=1448320 RepID=A0A319DUC1_9EURO|nr:hypothetical protein BO71DRAFT_42558 [Aspergillus ellipticus CBS 707.79]
MLFVFGLGLPFLASLRPFYCRARCCSSLSASPCPTSCQSIPSQRPVWCRLARALGAVLLWCLFGAAFSITLAAAAIPLAQGAEEEEVNNHPDSPPASSYSVLEA